MAWFNGYVLVDMLADVMGQYTYSGCNQRTKWFHVVWYHCLDLGKPYAGHNLGMLL